VSQKCMGICTRGKSSGIWIFRRYTYFVYVCGVGKLQQKDRCNFWPQTNFIKNYDKLLVQCMSHRLNSLNSLWISIINSSMRSIQEPWEQNVFYNFPSFIIQNKFNKKFQHKILRNYKSKTSKFLNVKANIALCKHEQNKAYLRINFYNDFI